MTEKTAETENIKAATGAGNKKPPVEKPAAGEETYGKRIVYTPLRFLALPPLHKITRLTLSEFDRLRHAVINDETLVNLPRYRRQGSAAELITRACHLLFALVEAGGLLASSPEREITKLKINIRDAKLGLLKPAHSSGFGNSENESDDEIDASEAFGRNGVRQPLYALGRLHLAAFIRFRMTKQKAADGENLLPELELSRAELDEIIKALPWLAKIPNKSGITWQGIFRHWLNTQLQIIGIWRGKVSWSNVAQIAAWRIIERERYPFLVALRRRLYQTVPLPDEKFTAIGNLTRASFISTRRPAFAGEIDAGSADGNSEAPPAEINSDDNSEDFEQEILESSSKRLKSNDQTNFGYVSRILLALAKSRQKNKVLAKALLEEAESVQLAGAGEEDLRSLLRWTAENLKDQKRISAAHTYAARVLRALFSMPQTGFASLKTEDIAEYLENYATNASVKNVRTTLEQFDNFLILAGKADAGHINWRSRSLQSPVAYAARDVISNREYKAVREMVRETVREAIIRENGNNPDESRKLQDLALLTLLRRCGLRVGEAAHLRPYNFKGFSAWCLDVTKSKTRAGVRKLPLYLLLDDGELAELRAFVGLRIKEAGMDGNLFAGSEGEPLTAHQLGRRAEKLLRAGGIEGETAHGLRHAFASSLFASFWLNLTEHRRSDNGESSAVLRALKEYARPEIEGRAAIKPVYLQQLLGHADLRVTFERYIHLVELAGADAVHLSEREDRLKGESLNVRSAAAIIGMDVKILGEDLKVSSPSLGDL